MTYNTSTYAAGLSRHTQRQLGRQLAALYDALPPAPTGPRLAAALHRLELLARGTATGSDH